MRHEFEPGNPDEWVEAIPVQAVRFKHRLTYLELINAKLPLDADGDPDLAAIKAAGPAAMAATERAFYIRKMALVAALVITGWSYGDVRPQIKDGELINEDALGEAPPEIHDFLLPYLRRITREPNPDPKAVTTPPSAAPSPVPAPAPPTA